MKVLEKNGQVIEGNFEEKEVKEAFWHTSAHVLAQAVKIISRYEMCDWTSNR